MQRDPEKIQAGIQAGMTVVEETRAMAREMGLDPRISLRVILDAHDATEIRPHYDKDLGEFVYSDPLTDHQTRLRAADMNLDLIQGIKVERLDITSGGQVIRTDAIPEGQRTLLQAIGSEFIRRGQNVEKAVDKSSSQPLSPEKGRVKAVTKKKK